jgi:hypothetical protein
VNFTDEEVAEDVALVEAGLTDAPRWLLAKPALSRLAAGAQGLEAIRALLKDSYGAGGDVVGRVRELLKSEENASSDARVEQDERHRVEGERDAAVQEADVLRARVRELQTENAMRRRRDAGVQEALKAAGVEGAALDMGVHRLKEERDAARAEVERLRAELAETVRVANGNWEFAKTNGDRAKVAESRLAAIREVVLCPESEDDVAAMPERVRNILEGDAPQEAKPERVKERSKATAHATSADSLANGYVRANDTATLFGARAEAPTHPNDIARREGFNEGAEAMREACLQVVIERLVRHGLQNLREDFKQAIEGVVP